MGGEVVLRRLVECFYDLMDEDPDYFGIRKLHPQELNSSRQKLFMFLSGWPFFICWEIRRATITFPAFTIFYWDHWTRSVVIMYE